MDPYKELSEEDQKTLLKFPVYISLLAANANGEMDKAEKNTAIQFDHIKPYTADPLLLGFYAKADQVFQSNLEEIDNELPKGKLQRDVAIKAELKKIKEILKKFSPAYANAMHKSMKSFKEHISEAHHNVLEDFLFPIPIKGLTD
ncbi:hypothetical protein ADIARSV_0085 [Arcticibacter svalbardensis MN12-7]|uniref:Uncharacterized protein n=1 Tax=Arcticibacter svalbardensis MN12-7 TaxID=1150600 RepID=R9GY02_9SPHI|nr:hypothetical protein [Arcticibacter svalbardensis]EOR96662.1 hypothetical protein ADIARSV_0085 [Arcticibacter svalbardensis MN12-7]